MDRASNVWRWGVEATALDVKMLLAGLLCDGADLDESDIRDVIRIAVARAVVQELTVHQSLTPALEVQQLSEGEVSTSPFFRLIEPAVHTNRSRFASYDNPVAQVVALAEGIYYAVSFRLRRVTDQAVRFGRIVDAKDA